MRSRIVPSLPLTLLGDRGWRLGLFVFPECPSWLRDAMGAVAT